MFLKVMEGNDHNEVKVFVAHQLFLVPHWRFYTVKEFVRQKMGANPRERNNKREKN
jgi:hypothetical protein